MELVSFYFHRYILKDRGYSKETGSVIICLIGAFFGLFFILDGGYYLFLLFDRSVTLISCFVLCFLQTYIAGHIIGEKKFQKMSYNITGETVPEYFFVIYRIIGPIIFAVFVFIALIKTLFYNESSSKVEGVIWPNLLEWFIISLPISLICYFYWKNKDIVVNHEKENLQDLTKLKNIDLFKHIDTLQN